MDNDSISVLISKVHNIFFPIVGYSKNSFICQSLFNNNHTLSHVLSTMTNKQAENTTTRYMYIIVHKWTPILPIIYKYYGYK